MPDHPNMWSDGSCVTDDLADVSVAGSGVFSTESVMAWTVRNWGHWMMFLCKVEVGMRGAVFFVRFLVLCSLFKWPSFGGLF